MSLETRGAERKEGYERLQEFGEQYGLTDSRMEDVFGMRRGTVYRILLATFYLLHREEPLSGEVFDKFAHEQLGYYKRELDNHRLDERGASDMAGGY